VNVLIASLASCAATALVLTPLDMVAFKLVANTHGTTSGATFQ